MNLSDGQFADLAGAVNNPDIGGFTAHASGAQAGRTPTNVYSVGTKTEERSQALPETKLSLQQFAQHHAATLDRPRRYLGGWQEEGKAYADVPRGYPATPAGETAARHASLRENQIAYGALGSADEGYLGTVRNPFHAANQGADVSAGNPAADAPVWADMPKRQGITSHEHLRRQAAKERRP